MSVLIVACEILMEELTSGEEILTFRAFSVKIFSSSTYDSKNRVYVVSLV